MNKKGNKTNFNSFWLIVCKQAHLWVMHASIEKQSDLAGGEFGKELLRKLAHLDLCNLFISALSEQNEIPFTIT